MNIRLRLGTCMISSPKNTKWPIFALNNPGCDIKNVFVCDDCIRILSEKLKTVNEMIHSEYYIE